MATAISIRKAKATKRVKSPRTIAIPPKNSVAVERYAIHAGIPNEDFGDRLVMINPELFDLHPLLEPLRRKLALTPVYGLQFLADDAQTRAEFRSKSAVAYLAQLKEIRSAMQSIASSEEVELLSPKRIQIQRVDENGV